MNEWQSAFRAEAPIERQSVAEMVAKRILEMVTSRALKPGDQIPPERDLAEMLNVSRPSVREAIRGLSILGVIKSRQGGGAYISRLDGDALLGPIRFFLALEDMNIRELYDARSLIEGDVARRAAKNMSDEQLNLLEAILDEQKNTLSDPKAFRVSDFKFHELIWIGSGNAFLKRIGESLNSLGLEFRRRASENSMVLEQSLKDHRALLDALKARDPEAAAQAAERHMQNVYHSTVAQDLEED
ncbi:FadR/GntR family transcriptional regulator [Roseibium sediminis]|uniref:FadR/GntR family transcriptional regulator n=1 Tax=Roseibium sediminis TaxID=1775174 RepID=UPI00123D9531|nr:FadR/GntR family transcriptional regulator [Roseibium sediminis]